MLHFAVEDPEEECHGCSSTPAESIVFLFRSGPRVPFWLSSTLIKTLANNLRLKRMLIATLKQSFCIITLHKTDKIFPEIIALCVILSPKIDNDKPANRRKGGAMSMLFEFEMSVYFHATCAIC